MARNRRAVKRSAVIIGGILLLVLGFSVLSGLEMDARKPAADPTDAPLVALGEEVYRDHCASCHGVELEGQPDWQTRKPDGRLPAPPHDKTGHTWHHPEEVLFRLTRDGPSAMVPGYESDMPGFADVLTDEEIWAVLAYIKSRWPDDIRARHAEIESRSSRSHACRGGGCGCGQIA
jgi:mono/diheme cytochrome c family protein